MSGSGDFTGRLDEPTEISQEDFEEWQKASVDQYIEDSYGFHARNIFADTFRAGADNLIYRLIEEGWGDKTVFEVGAMLGIVYEDGSWT